MEIFLKKKTPGLVVGIVFNRKIDQKQEKKKMRIVMSTRNPRRPSKTYFTRIRVFKYVYDEDNE